MLKDTEHSAAALYDGGWRSKDKEQLQQEYHLTDEETAALVEELEEMEQPEENRIEDMTPAEVWEGFVGEQSPEEFMAISRDQAQGTIEEAVKAYTQDINLMFNSNYTPEERDTIAEKLVEYIEGSAPKRISLDNGLTYHTAETLPEEFPNGRKYLEGEWWEVVVYYMDDEAREQVVHHFQGETNRDFLREYLEIAPCDLIIG